MSTHIIFVVAFDFGTVSKRCCQKAVELEAKLIRIGIVPEIWVTAGYSQQHEKNMGIFMGTLLRNLNGRNVFRGNARDFNTEGEVVELWRHLEHQGDVQIHIVNKWWHLPRTQLLLWWHQPAKRKVTYRWVPIKHWYKGAFIYEIGALIKNVLRAIRRDGLPRRFKKQTPHV